MASVPDHSARSKEGGLVFPFTARGRPRRTVCRSSGGGGTAPPADARSPGTSGGGKGGSRGEGGASEPFERPLGDSVEEFATGRPTAASSPFDVASPSRRESAAAISCLSSSVAVPARSFSKIVSFRLIT